MNNIALFNYNSYTAQLYILEATVKQQIEQQDSKIKDTFISNINKICNLLVGSYACNIWKFISYQ